MKPLIVGLDDLPAEPADTAPRIVLTGLGPAEEVPPVAADATAPAEAAAPDKPLYLDVTRVKALTQSFAGYACASCDKLQAMWAFLPTDKGPDPDPIPICSLCFLYKHPWGRGRARELRAFIQMIEERGNVTYEKDSGGDIVRPRNADAVMFAIYQGSRMRASLDSMAAAGRGVGRG